MKKSIFRCCFLLAITLLNTTPSQAATSLLDELEQRTFQYFWDTTDARTGMAPDRAPRTGPLRSASSIAATGFALTAYPIGAEHGWVTRSQAAQRSLITLRFLWSLPQGAGKRGVAGHHGFFYHFLDMQTGLRAGQSELSSIDTTLLLAGVLTTQAYFDHDTSDEREIRELAQKLYARVDWRWLQVRAPLVAMGWTPENGFIPVDWQGYNEAMLLYILALGAPEHDIAPDAWQAWTRSYEQHWKTEYGQTYLSFPSLFIHQYSHVWIDFRGIRDAFMRGKGIDYFENSRRAALAQRIYAIDNPLHCQAYGPLVWGLTASDGPGDFSFSYEGRKLKFFSYAAHGIGGTENFDDCTITPTAAAASIVFIPELATQAIAAMHTRFGAHIYTQYGFVDAFNPSFTWHVKSPKGEVVPDAGWVARDYLGIDQGPILAMLENQRSGLIWQLWRRHPAIRTGLQRAGFNGGWLEH